MGKSQKGAVSSPANASKMPKHRMTIQKQQKKTPAPEISSESESDIEDLEAASEMSSEMSSDESGSEIEKSDSEVEEESDEDDDIPKRKKAKTDDGSEAFSNAFSNIIGSRLKAHDRAAPIMARNKSVVKKLESDKLEAKAKRALLSEKKQLYQKSRVKNLLPTENAREVLESEKKLKKVAQKGVVRLFNAIMATQVKTNQAIQQEKVGETKKKELFNEMSKEKFLDLVQSAGDS